MSAPTATRRGTLRDEPLPSLLYRCFQEHATGVLVLVARAGSSEVYLRDGYPVAVELPGAVDRLGSLLVAAGALDPGRYKQSLATPLPAGTHYGRMLLEQGLITAEQLVASLRLQLRRRLHRLFFVDDASFVLEGRSHDRGAEGGEDVWVDPRRAIYQGVRSAWSEPRFGRAIDALGGQRLALAVDAAALASYGLKEEDARLVSLLAERPRTLAELEADSGLAAAAVRPLVYTLLATEALLGASIGARPATPRREPTTERLLVFDDATAPGPTSAAASNEALAEAVRKKAATVDGEDLWAVLGVASGASRTEVRAAYIAAAKLYHPDRVTAAGLASLRADAERIFRRVSEAHSTLTDENRRAAYLARANEPAASAAATDGNRVLAAEMAFLEGEVAFKRRDFPAALASLGRAVEMNPSEGEAVALFAWARLCAGQAPGPEVRADLERAIKLSPRCARAHYYLGMVLKQQGDVERALASFQRAAQLDERLAEAQSEMRVLAARERKSADGRRGLFDRLLGRGR